MELNFCERKYALVKVSKYNIVFKKDDDDYIFNTLNCSLVLIKKGAQQVLESIQSNKFNKKEASDNKIFQALVDGGFIVSEELNELELINFINWKGKLNSDKLKYTIFPTLRCNCNCVYCYQGKKNNDLQIMQPQTADDISEKIIKAMPNKKSVQLIWHGGEPLLAKDIIWRISDKVMKYAGDYGINYSGFILTNGCLIDNSTVENFLKYKILGAQITIDGLPKTHNERRKYNNGRGTFQDIVDNILELQKNGIEVDVRLNIDKNNYMEIDDIVILLLSYGINGESMYLGHIKTGTNNDLNIEEYAQACVRLQKSLIKNTNTTLSLKRWFPKLKTFFCIADTLSSCSFDPQGTIYKCWHEVGDKHMAYSDVENNINSAGYYHNLNYFLYSVKDSDRCADCKVLPLCMCGCRFLKKAENVCSEYKYNLLEILKGYCGLMKPRESKDEVVFLAESNKILQEDKLNK